MRKGGKILVVMPAYNAEKTLERTIRDIPQGYADEIILCDDCSHDNTVALAKRLGLTVVVHSQNKGYGANQNVLCDGASKGCRHHCHGPSGLPIRSPCNSFRSRLFGSGYM